MERSLNRPAHVRLIPPSGHKNFLNRLVGIKRIIKMSTVPWVLRAAAVTDAKKLASFAARSYNEAVGSDTINPVDLREHLKRSFGVTQQTHEIESSDYRTILAWRGSEIEAFCQVRRSNAPECVKNCNYAAPVELLRLYVDSSAHGLGLAQHLMKEARVVGESLGGQHLWLKVFESNRRGIAFYTKEGFRDVGSAYFFVGADRQIDRVLAAPIGK
jgi:ribosomal protein S18 acetylase RimI-like enzyme